MKPVVLVFGGHDPTGGAGIQADIETIGTLGGQAVTIPTALTLQSSKRVIGFEPVAVEPLLQQAELLLEEFNIQAIKIGMVGNATLCAAIHTIVRQHPEIPLVLDPVLAGGGGGTLSANNLADTIRTLLLPLTTLSTPNRAELQQLLPETDTMSARCEALLQQGCQNLLVTGTDNPAPDELQGQVYHQLWMQDGASRSTSRRFDYPRLPHSYHGSGCTLAAAIATKISFGNCIEDAVRSGLDYSWNSLQQGHRPAAGQHFPNRFFQQHP